MAKDTPSMAKNKIKRSLYAICDPHPLKREEDELWEYFDSHCAYCGVSIGKASRTGHLDHLIPTSEGGSNSIHNHALSCAKCNGDEKREESWESFLKRKSLSRDTFESRKSRISNWLQRAPTIVNEPEMIAVRDAIINEALANFDSAVVKMRALRDRSI